MRGRILVAAALVGLTAGCANIPPAQVGQTAGTIAGAAIAPGVGAPLGALVGTVAGMIFQGHIDKVTEGRERQELGGQLRPGPAGPGEPDTAPAGAPMRVWVDETVQDGRLVAGHFDSRLLP
jgi:hypothetical protein